MAYSFHAPSNSVLRHCALFWASQDAISPSCSKTGAKSAEAVVTPKLDRHHLGAVLTVRVGGRPLVCLPRQGKCAFSGANLPRSKVCFRKRAPGCCLLVTYFNPTHLIQNRWFLGETRSRLSKKSSPRKA